MGKWLNMVLSVLKALKTAGLFAVGQGPRLGDTPSPKGRNIRDSLKR